MEAKLKFLKAKFKESKKIISFTDSFDDLLRSLELSFKLSLIPLESSNYTISYIDDEDDNINIENSYDFSEALRFGENSNQNYLNLLIFHKCSTVYRKDNKDNFEYIEVLSTRSNEYKASPQIEFLIPRGEKQDMNTIQRLEDLKYSCDEQNQSLIRNLKKVKNFKKEDIIMSKSPEISIDLSKQMLLKKNNFEITYEKDSIETIQQRLNDMKEKVCKRMQITNSNQILINQVNEKKHEKKFSDEKKEQCKFFKLKNTEKKEKDLLINSEKDQSDIKKFTKCFVKKAFSKEMIQIKNEISSGLNQIMKKHYDLIKKKNTETTQKLEEIFQNLKHTIKNPNKIHNGFDCRICKNSPILGIRYKCSVCKDYNICETCEDICTHPHPFIKIRSCELNPAFIKTITFDNSSNYSENDEEENVFYNDVNGNKHIEKFIDFDNFKNSTYNYFELENNNDILKYVDNKKEKESNKNEKKNEVVEKFKISCINMNELFEIKNSKGNEFKIVLKIKNVGKESLPNPCYLQCISEESDISGKAVPINFTLKPGMIINPELTLNVSGLKKGTYLSIWKMQTTQREFFGEEIPLKIKIEKTDDLKINQNFIEENKSLGRIDIAEILPDKIPNKVDNCKSSKYDVSSQTRIISLDDYKKLKMMKKKSYDLDSEKKIQENKSRQVDYYTLADEIIAKYPEKNMNKNELLNALFRTGGHEKNSIMMATNDEVNVCRHYNKHMFN